MIIPSSVRRKHRDLLSFFLHDNVDTPISKHWLYSEVACLDKLIESW